MRLPVIAGVEVIFAVFLFPRGIRIDSATIEATTTKQATTKIKTDFLPIRQLPRWVELGFLIGSRIVLLRRVSGRLSIGGGSGACL